MPNQVKQLFCFPFHFPDQILEKIQEAGFEVALQKEVQLTEEQAKVFYKEQEGTPHFEDLIREMTAYVIYSHHFISTS